MGTTIMFFDVECANGCTYNLKELRRIIIKAIGARVKELRVFSFGDRGRRSPRVAVVPHEFTQVDFAGIEQELLKPKGIYLQEVAETHVEAVAYSVPVDPATVPVTIKTVPARSGV